MQYHENVGIKIFPVPFIPAKLDCYIEGILSYVILIFVLQVEH